MVALGVSEMLCKVLEAKKVTTRFGERLVLTVEHDGGEEEIWVNDPDYPIQVGDSVPVESSNGKLKLVKGKKTTNAVKASSSGNNEDAVAELVTLFRAIRDALPDETSEAIAKMAITLFLRK
jgi:hypothetical protein